MYVVINYQKGEIESTSAPWVILVINVNISLVGLILLSSIFQMSSTLKWQGKRMWNPFNMLKTNIGKISRLFISILVIQDHIESIRKPILLKGMRCCLMACLLKVLSDMLQSPQPLYHIHTCPKQNSNSALPKLSIRRHRV